LFWYNVVVKFLLLARSVSFDKEDHENSYDERTA